MIMCLFCSWLREWKLRADREERRKTEKKQGEDKKGGWPKYCFYYFYLFVLLNQLMIFFFFFTDSDWDCGEENFQDGEDMLCNTLLITGPTGVGKTAAVYACAQELGFKVQTLTGSYVKNVTLMH